MVYGRPRAALDVAHDLHHVVAHQRLAARHLHHAGTQLFHVAAVFRRLQIARFVARPAVVAVLAVAGARIRHFERNDDRPLGEPVQRPSPDNPQRLDQGNLAQIDQPRRMAMVTCGALLSEYDRGSHPDRGRRPGRVGAQGRPLAGLPSRLLGVLHGSVPHQPAGCRAPPRGTGRTWNPQTRIAPPAFSSAPARGGKPTTSHVRRSTRTTGTCDLYAARPLTCRTFGPPVRCQSGALAICELCFDGATEEEIEASIVDLDVESLDPTAATETTVALALLALLKLQPVLPRLPLDIAADAGLLLRSGPAAPPAPHRWPPAGRCR